MDARMGSSKVLVRHGGTRPAPHHLLLHRHVADQTQPRTTPPQVPPKEVAQKALRYSISIPFRPLCFKICSHYREAGHEFLLGYNRPQMLSILSIDCRKRTDELAGVRGLTVWILAC